MSKRPKSPKKLDETTVKKAVADLKITKLSTEMDRVGWSPATVARLAYYLQSASGLIIRYPDAVKTEQRDAFVAATKALVAANLEAEAHVVTVAFEQVRIAEDGFQRLFRYTTDSPWHKLPPAVRIAALFERAAREIQASIDDATAQIGATQHFNLINPTIRTTDNRPVDAEAPINTIVSGLSASIMMVAYQAGWFKGDVLVIPELPPVTAEELEFAGAPIYLAAGWHRWETIEEQARLIGPPLVELTGSDVPEVVRSNHERAYKYQPPDRLWYNQVAIWRFHDRTRQTRAELTRDQRIPPLTALEDHPALPPKSVISESEFFSYIALCERLGLDIADNQRLIKGLKLTEWLRGFSTLSVMAAQQYEKNAVFSQVWSYREILKTLTSAGLSSDKAAKFISNVTVHKKTRDLFDAPLIAMHDDQYLVLIPTMLENSPYDIMMSVFSELKESFDGKPFEGRVIQLFRENGIPAENIKFKIDGKEYDCDVVCVWSGHVLLIECKNKSLPGQRATLAHHFDHEVIEDIDQVTRLRDGLIAKPEQLNQRFGPGTSELPITMIVVRNAPYSRRGAVDDVYFYDFSALARFFKSRHMQVSTGPQKGPFVSVPYATLWADEQPTISDLLKELEDPAQLRINHYHTRKVVLMQGLDTKTIALSEVLIREEMTHETLVEFRNVELAQDTERQAAEAPEAT